MALGFSVWLWFVSLVALGISSVTSPTLPSVSPRNLSDLSECFPRSPSPWLWVLGFGLLGGFGSVALALPFRFVCPLLLSLSSCVLNVLRLHYLAIFGYPVVISGRSCFPSCYPLACRLACLLGSLPTPPTSPSA